MSAALALKASAYTMVVGRTRVPVATLKEASEIFCQARDASGRGASQTPTPIILDATGKPFAYVSYNGRVWAGHPCEPFDRNKRPIYDNREPQAESLDDFARRVLADGAAS